MNARAKPPANGDIIAASSILGLLPLHHERAVEWYGLASHYADIARRCYEAGDHDLGEGAGRKAVEHLRLAWGLSEDISEAKATEAKVASDRDAAATTTRSRTPARETEAAHG